MNLEHAPGAKPLVCIGLKNWLNFRVRNRFEIQILIVQRINTTYTMCICWNFELESAIIWKLVTCQQITSKKHANSMGRPLSPRNGHVILVSRYPVLTAVNSPQQFGHAIFRQGKRGLPKSIALFPVKKIQHILPPVGLTPDSLPLSPSVCMDGRSYADAITKILGWIDYQIFLTMGLRSLALSGALL